MMKSFHKILVFSILLISSTPIISQDYLVDRTYLGSRTKFELLLIFGQLVDYDIDLYRIRYKTPDVNLQPDTASALLVLPKVTGNEQVPMVFYAHGTTSGPNDVPSQLRGGYEIAMAYAGFGFATIAPDYLGLGDSRGFHPYLHAESEASASIDAIWAALEYLDTYDPEWNPYYLFLAGYSQGGHVSMALQKNIEDFWSIFLPVTAATHMSGPYSLSGAMRDRVLSDESYGFPSYIGYIFLGFNEAYNLYDDIGQIFKEPYASDIDSFYNGLITLPELNGRLIAELSEGGDTIVKRMLHDSIVDAITNDPDHPLNQSLRENDTYNFAPSSPTRLYYCGGDTQVPPVNSILADSVMNALGADDVEAINLNPDFDHGPCVLPAVTNSIDFFLSFIITSGLEDIDKGDKALKIFPNPSIDEVVIDWDLARHGMDYIIINTKGETIVNGQSKSNKISVENLPGGIYMVVCTSGGETRMARMVRR